MIDSLKDTMFAKSEVGMTTSLGSAVISYLDILNPVLSAVTLIIGVGVGALTLMIKWKEYNAS
jgi:hypothetical protein|tara:strand:+ start:45 stop:233 length:189 start_codon:yes stop_codon:yes gene_type:complete